ncbi:MAG: 3-hydroxyacyl-CoA dehydrogenase [Corynebacteriales bacterium]|nr:3-hydroxyacyl-CoA dehydrogenase [Mycobacteriales bacterium]
MTLVLPEEVVTTAQLRLISPPGLEGTLALITLENGHDHKRPTTLGPAGLASLAEAIDTAKSTEGVRGIAITGKPYFFGAGADLNGVALLEDRKDARAILELGHQVFGQLRSSELPTFAFINGLSLGGATELALHADYRTMSGAAAGIALPEVFLGLAPGWGGTWLLPHLVGIENALKVIIENPLAQNKMLKPTDALNMGLVDAEFESADYLTSSISWAVKVINGEISVDRAQVDTGEGWDFAVMVAEKIVEEKLHGAAHAPLVALKLLGQAKSASYEDQMLAEEDLISELASGPQLRAGMYAFDLVQKRARKPAGAPDKSLARPVTKVGIVGAGLMASQLALLFARRLKVPVVLTDVSQERIDKGLAYVKESAEKLVAKGRTSADSASRIVASVTGSLDKSGFADADFVIEAVFEELEIKRHVFAELETIVRPDCVLATNTSSLSVSAMADQLTHPERVVGFHFFNPVAVMPLLEIVRAKETDDASLATAFAVGKGLKKSCVLVKDAPAFVVNRLLVRSLVEVLLAIDAGTDPITANNSIDDLGLPMRPLELIELVGPPIALHAAETLAAAFPDRFAVPNILRATVEAGKPALLVRKSGALVLDPDLAGTLTPGSGPSAAELRENVLGAVATEVRLMLDDGVVSAPEDIDLCMITGAGWPFHLGGITPYLRQAGYL